MTTQPNPASSADSPGSGVLREGRYRLRSKLGQGGMGSVYLAEDTLLPGRLVAVKENADSSADAQAQFKREALLLARLRHPNLPQVMDYFIEADGKQYLVMDYVPGDNLLELMRKRQGPLPAAEALAIVEQVMQALAYMHTWRDPDSGRTRPIIHRDIKPANIKRTPEGRVVLVDFGIAKVDSGTMTGTAVSAKALTPGYAPLEQYGGGTDARSDIYSLGATLYALLTGKAPPSATDMAMAADKQRAPLLTGLKAAPPAAAKVIERAMQSLPKDRYQSIDAMYQALYNRPLPVTGIVNPPPPAHQGMASSRQLGWLVGALGVLLAVGMGWLLFAQSNDLPGAPVAVLPTPSPITPTLPPATTPAARATAGQSARAAEPPTSAPTPEPSDTATSAPTETPSATASATPIPSATTTPHYPTATSPHYVRRDTYIDVARPTATIDATVTAVELEVAAKIGSNTDCISADENCDSNANTITDYHADT
jgi:serine/threonine protein kinase